MAKRKHSPEQLPPQQHGPLKLDTRTLTRSAKDLREDLTLYANHAQFSITPMELYIDLYRLEPDPHDLGKVNSYFIQRVSIPVSLAKGFATGIANSVAALENTLGIALPLSREPDETDTIKIWEKE